MSHGKLLICFQANFFYFKDHGSLSTAIYGSFDEDHVFGFWAAAPKGTMSSRTQGDFRSFVYLSVRSFVHSFVPLGSNPSLKAQISASRLNYQAQIPASRPIPALRLKFQPRGPNPSLDAQI